MSLKNRKVLITGATGFVGANLLRYCLNLGAKAYIFTRKSSDNWRIADIMGDVRQYRLDLTDDVKLKAAIRRIKPEFILHSAAYGGHPYQTESDKIFAANLTGTMNLVSACARTGFRLFINTGSSSEYGLKNKPMREDQSLEPVTDYGAAKAAATLFCIALAKKEKLPIVTLRLFSPYGYYEDGRRLMPHIIISSLRKKRPALSSPRNVRDFVFIEDVLDAFLKAMLRPAGLEFGQIINIGSGRQKSISDVLGVVARSCGYKLKPKWGALNTRPEPAFWQADISQAKDVLKWQPRHDLKQGIDKMLRWFSNNIRLYS
ncbi:MAG: NAD(P)-dependent oxidoreductase [Candidatus Omnitrophica bacterium]|nr:NAD(P)-dependent oxidoreductase [Candidatus Omnitrophota bacterium]